MTSARGRYQAKVKYLKDRIGVLQRRMNKNLNDHKLVEQIAIKQSHLRVEMKLYERKIQIINERYGNAA
jgi:translation elongation factor EF-Ts